MDVPAIISYAVLLTAIYSFIRFKVIKEMVRKHVMTSTSAKELTGLLDAVYAMMLVVGIFVGILSTTALAFLLVASIIIIPFVLYDLLKSLVYYYILVTTKMFDAGNFVILTRGIRGWIKRITPFFVELRGEYDETIRVPNGLAAVEPVRIPSRSLPFTITVKVINVKDFSLVEEALRESVTATKRFSVIEPKVKIRSMGNDWVEYEIMYGLGNYEVTNEIMKTLVIRLKRLLEKEGVKVEVRREHALMSR